MTKSLASALAVFPEGQRQSPISPPPHRPHGETHPASYSMQVLETSLNQTSAVEFHSSVGLLGNGEQEWGNGRSLWPGPLQRNGGSRAGRTMLALWRQL